MFIVSGKNPTEILSLKVCFTNTFALCEGKIKTASSKEFVVFKMSSIVSEIKDCIDFFSLNLIF